MNQYLEMLYLFTKHRTTNMFGLAGWIAYCCALNTLQLNFIVLDMEVCEIKTVLIKKTQIYMRN